MAQPRSTFPTNAPKISVFNNAVTDIPGFRVVVPDATGGIDAVKLPTAVTDPIKGVTGPEGIPAKTWGSLIVVGGSKIPIVNTGGVTQGARLGIAPALNGTVAPLAPAAGANASLVGICEETTPTLVAGEVTFSGPGILAQG